ncbi:MAG: DNA primase catalytic subunit PriS [Candidatus Thermoplasmatota archaeon]|uniref:DNA primase small subunit PriS n=1 Tax=Candidatus Sysuiplasma superficiale TaxID=2823368 RepID=A0A8J7YKF1_9ARCH|nr:DNA primase catalytic subunit PriS [Candidatus Sysuiplasma superficiale]MCL4347104.1 DNA primase catalytic subunit PriS [Candidatus Thermoplasmatota archaeon]
MTDSVPKELIFARDMFGKYYREHTIHAPPRSEAREFGFMFFDRTFVHRHIHFHGEGELNDYLRGRSPSHGYYSAARYARPDADTMAEKGWEGADLIFDLDADHVKGSEKLEYDRMLEQVKDVLIRLYDDYITGDLGFGEKETEIVFSGGRGYHIHIYSSSVAQLGSHERREIVDYITGNGLDVSMLFRRQVVGVDEKTGKKITSMRAPSAMEGGWYARAARALEMALEHATDMGTILKFLTDAGLNERQAGRMASVLVEMGGRDRIKDTGLIDVFARSGRYDDSMSFAAMLTKIASETMAGQTDEPVTSDVHRLIRIPGTLHGKTGLKVISMTRNSLDSFNPLEDAVARFDDSEVTVISRTAFETPPFMGERVRLNEGKNRLPSNLALFLILRRQVQLP